MTIETDPEQTRTEVSITTKMPKRYLRSTRRLPAIARASDLWNQMLNARLDEIRRKPDAPFVFGMSRSGGFVRSADAFTQMAMVKEGGVADGFSALLEEDLRVDSPRIHGVRARSREARRAPLIRAIRQRARQRPRSRTFAREIVRNFLEDEAMPGIEAELALAQKLLPTITLDELNKLGDVLSKGSRVVAIEGPTAMTKPTEAAVLAMTKTVEARDIKAYDDAPPTTPLMTDVPTPGPVVATKTIPEIGVTEWTLKNGARVILKPTDFKNDEVRMMSFAPGGTSMAPDADYESVKFTDAILTQGGVGSFDANTLRKALAGKVVSVGAYISELEEGVNAVASPSDLDSMFQLVHLHFTAPRRDESAFLAWRARETETVKNRRLSPEAVFTDELGIFSSQNHKRRQPTTPESLARIDYSKAFAFYKD